MQLSETVKLYPDRSQKELIESAMQEYVACANRLVSDAVSGVSIAKLSSAGVNAALPSALKNQCIRRKEALQSLSLGGYEKPQACKKRKASPGNGSCPSGCEEAMLLYQ